MSEIVKTRDGREFMMPSAEDDAKILAAAMSDADARPLTEAEWEAARPLMFRGGGELLASEPVAAFRATGRGWEARVKRALADWLRTHSPLDA